MTTHEDSLETEYRVLATRAGAFADQLANQVSTLLSNAAVALAVPMQSRVKTWKSLTEKFARVNLSVDTLREVQDLIGLRVILLFKRDIDVVCKSIARALQVVRMYDTGQRLGENQFGYSSIHYIVRLPPAWASVPSFSGMGDLIAEIQVRTLAQHMWAEVSQLLQYKREASVPAPVRRALSRSSAVLELMDNEFDRMLQERDAYRATAAGVASKTEVLNVDLLEKNLDKAFPAKNKGGSEPYAELLSELHHLNVTTVDQLWGLVRKRLADVERHEQEYVLRTQQDVERRKQSSGIALSRAKAGTYFTHAGLLRAILGEEFGHNVLQSFWDRPPPRPPFTSAVAN